jgi:hypothetical protein
MASNSPQDLSKLAKDALYVTVGLGVIAVQKAQVQRQQFQKRVEDRVKTVEERLEGIRSIVSRGAA